MEIIPLDAIPAQTVSVILDGQNVQINLYQKYQGLFVDVNSNGTDISTGVIAQNRNALVRQVGFSGNLAFRDTQGSDDPCYTGLGSRYQLIYLTDAELENVELY